MVPQRNGLQCSTPVISRATVALPNRCVGSPARTSCAEPWPRARLSSAASSASCPIASPVDSATRSCDDVSGRTTTKGHYAPSHCTDQSRPNKETDGPDSLQLSGGRECRLDLREKCKLTCSSDRGCKGVRPPLAGDAGIVARPRLESTRPFCGADRPRGSICRPPSISPAGRHA